MGREGGGGGGGCGRGCIEIVASGKSWQQDRRSVKVSQPRHVTHDEMAIDRKPCLFSNKLKRLFQQNQDISSCLILRYKILQNFKITFLT